jgi:hypothetical protein
MEIDWFDEEEEEDDIGEKWNALEH